MPCDTDPRIRGEHHLLQLSDGSRRNVTVYQTGAFLWDLGENCNAGALKSGYKIHSDL